MKEKIVGAVWGHIMNDYGHIDDETPSLAISLYEEYRNLGLGTALMKEMRRFLKIRDISRYLYLYRKKIMRSVCIES